MITANFISWFGQVLIGAVTGVALGSLMMASLVVLSARLRHRAWLTLPILFIARFILIGMVLWWLATIGSPALISSVVCLLTVRIWVLQRCVENI